MKSNPYRIHAFCCDLISCAAIEHCYRFPNLCNFRGFNWAVTTPTCRKGCTSHRAVSLEAIGMIWHPQRTCTRKQGKTSWSASPFDPIHCCVQLLSSTMDWGNYEVHTHIARLDLLLLLQAGYLGFEGWKGYWSKSDKCPTVGVWSKHRLIAHQLWTWGQVHHKYARDDECLFCQELRESAKLQDSIVLHKGTSWNFLTRIVTVEWLLVRAET